MLSDDTALPYGGQPNMQTIIEACLCAAEEAMNAPGIHHALFREQLATSVSHDRKVNSTRTLGYNRDPSDMPIDPLHGWHGCDDHLVTINGQSY